MWRILDKRELESRRRRAKARDRIADESYLRAHGGSDHEAAYRGRFYRAYEWQVTKGRIRARRLTRRLDRSGATSSRMVPPG